MIDYEGYASTWQPPYNMGWHSEEIARGAFTKTLAEKPRVQFNLSHGAGASGFPFAQLGKNMTLTEDAYGLLVRAQLDEQDPDVQLLARKVKSGMVSDMSFGFRCVRDQWNETYTLRRIVEASLHDGDVTVTPVGANPAAGVVSMRSASELAALRAPARDAEQRRELAGQLGQTVVLEVRSVSFDGVQYGADGGTRSARPRRASRGPVVLPDHTASARLMLARSRASSKGDTGPDVAPIVLARFDLARARRKAKR
jgi:uncharacterized protein